MGYLITGATGFLGQHVLRQLSQSTSLRHPSTRHCVLVRRAADWSTTAAADLLPVHVIEGGLERPELWHNDPRLQSLSGIFHLAAKVQHSRFNIAPVYAANVDGTLHVIRLAAARRCRVIYISTSGTVGVFHDAHGSADEHTPLCDTAVRRWPYYHSKVRAEQEGRALAHSLGVDLVVLRPPMMLGPGDHKFRATGQIVRFLRGRLPFIVKGGIHYVDIRDAAAAIVAAMGHAHPQTVYNLPGTACSIATFFPSSVL